MITSGFSVALISFGFLTYFLFDLLGLYSITIKLENILLIIQKVALYLIIIQRYLTWDIIT